VNAVATLAQMMTTSPLTVQMRSSARDALALADRSGVHHVLVIDGSELVGVACVCDLATALDPDAVTRHMQPPPAPLAIDDRPERVADLMQLSGASCFPIVDPEGRLAGVVTRSDLRRTGYLASERGVDVCAACGTSHHLKPRCREEPVFCSDCIEQVKSSGVREMYFTLGGGD
jgi:CBS domain-containing protein